MAIFSAAGLSSAPVTNVLDEGKYVVRIDKMEGITSKQKQTPGIKMDLVVISGAPQNNESKIEGRHIFHTLYLPLTGDGHDISLQKLAKLCRAADVPQTDDLNLDDFLMKEIVVTVKHSTYNGEPKEEVTSYSKNTITL